MMPQAEEGLPMAWDERKPLTDQQQRIYDYLRRAVRERGYPPSVREIGDAVGLNSSATVHGHLNQLVAKGYIRRDASKGRAVEVLADSGSRTAERIVEVPVVGQVAAGLPILAEEHIEDRLPISTSFVRADPRELFFLTVKGDSMVDAGILSGDYILVKRQDTVVNGEIAVAVIDGEATVKRFFKEKNRIRLQPENQFMDPIYVQDCQIAGKVVGVIRRI
jgi:repressor LexA